MLGNGSGLFLGLGQYRADGLLVLLGYSLSVGLCLGENPGCLGLGFALGLFPQAQGELVSLC